MWEESGGMITVSSSKSEWELLLFFANEKKAMIRLALSMVTPTKCEPLDRVQKKTGTNQCVKLPYRSCRITFLPRYYRLIVS